MASFDNRFRYSIPAQLSAESFDATIYANFTWAVENRKEFPRELCPDAWKWFPDRDTSKLPREVYYIPRGSWLGARLAQLFGGQDHFVTLLREGKNITGVNELHLDIDVTQPDDNKPMGRLVLIFNREMMRLEGRCLRGQDRAISDDFEAAVCSSPLSVARCDLRLAGESIGWNGKQYFGEGMRRSRFADIQDEDEKHEKLKSLSVELKHGDDSVADDPALLKRIAEYLALETADCEFIEGNLKYLRSAVIDDCQYWIWDYRESDGTQCYVTLRLDEHRSVLGVQNANELSPEQHIYAQHHDFAEDEG
jgi:hypothetical protein